MSKMVTKHRHLSAGWGQDQIYHTVSSPLLNLHISPLGVVPKKASGEYRIIHHLSHPRGSSVNDAIDSELCLDKYTSFDAAVAMVRVLGCGVLLAK